MFKVCAHTVFTSHVLCKHNNGKRARINCRLIVYTLSLVDS